MTLTFLAHPNATFARKSQNRSDHSPFRYVIVYNEVKVNNEESSYTRRDVEVLLDENAFSENTLKELFKLLSQRFPEPDGLTVDVYTSLEQIDTPEEHEGGRMFAESRTGTRRVSPEELNFRKHPSAVLMRQNGNELFRYTIRPNNLKLKTVILKGHDPIGN
ncbi:MAG: hypothetical protein AUG51_23330 [Acidobacteria bacterium 13_1_20CM_3_53_8]|nr:MAG: hypothetical protein AUG51_23330 [Acidobacteria bacterium 13_1_20CM_3_53_8]